MSRRRKRNSKRPGVEPYTGPILRSGLFMTMEDGTEYEFTIPKNVVADDEWQQMIEEGWELDERR